MNNDSDKQMDARLAALLRTLPDKPVASNFTARVLQTIEHENAARRRRSPWIILRSGWRWLPRMAMAALVLAFGVLSYQHQAQNRRVQMARSVAVVSQVASLPSADELRDFEAIRRLSQPADKELLALLR